MQAEANFAKQKDSVRTPITYSALLGQARSIKCMLFGTRRAHLCVAQSTKAGSTLVLAYWGQEGGDKEERALFWVQDFQLCI